MSIHTKYILHCIVTALAVTMLFSCQGDYNSEMQKLSYSKRFPVGEAENIFLVYTDSGKVKSTLRSPYNKDFSNQKFPFSEFPKGVIVKFFDDQNNENTITADYAILYSDTRLVDLQGNVTLTTHKGDVLAAPQLFWDQDREWIFTEGEFKISNEYGVLLQGTNGIDFNRDLSIMEAHEIYDSTIPIDEKDK
ncbi:LPS export ABC transporter periplasmic protein LptC [uncultured Kordia sp.]|uniref:LPS export ABC transporter periplasmic protein LptC n=1 Tax=uncultured Kordia sp. TaxID=507699 RepID=UPI002638252A|nr:LPS export ABC transporter periplasmic protein LptC [uncultured Kordia sp.]